MQNSELYRRGFVVPLDHNAETALNNNNVNHTTSVDFFEISDNSVFEELFEKRFFEFINLKLGSMIDDYEEERIDYKKISSLKDVLREFIANNMLNSEEQKVVNALIKLCNVALEKRTSLFFIL